MEKNRRVFGYRCLTICALAIASLGLWISSANQAEARGRGGPSKAQIQQAQQQMQAQQAQQAKIAAAQQKKDKEILDRYDTNKNGKIDGSEKPAFDKYMREVKSGKVPHPYASLKIDNTPATDAKKKK